jgi:hypothetical protein
MNSSTIFFLSPKPNNLFVVASAFPKRFTNPFLYLLSSFILSGDTRLKIIPQSGEDCQQLPFLATLIVIFLVSYAASSDLT